MTLEWGLGVLTAVGLLVYLTIALLYPEKFSL